MQDTPTAATIAGQYFERMRARDPGVADLFHEDGSIIGLGTVTTGREAIRSFYDGAIRGASPTPEQVGDFLESGTRVAVEIRIALADGTTVHAVDLFVVEEGLIRSLTYFIADH